MSERIVLVTGATGKQGGAVARSLVGLGFKLRGMTRKPEGEAAKALEAQGVQVIHGDLDDAEALKTAVSGVWGVFSVQNTWEAGIEGEEAQGKRVATIAREMGVHHFVYTSVGSADRGTGIPHFENKWRVEQFVRALQFPSYAILRPVFFMENLLTSSFLNGDQIVSTLGPTLSLQMVAVEDIGRIGARLFAEAESMNGREIDLAGDSVTMPKATRVIGGALGRTLRYVGIPIAEVRKHRPEIAVMLEWFERVGFDADLPALEREFGRLTRIEDWAGRTVHA